MSKRLTVNLSFNSNNFFCFDDNKILEIDQAFMQTSSNLRGRLRVEREGDGEGKGRGDFGEKERDFLFLFPSVLFYVHVSA